MKAIIRTIIVVLLIAAVAGLGWVSYGFREWDTNEWKNEIEDLTEEQPVVDGDGNVLDPDGVNPLPSAMTFSSAINLAGAATSVTVHASVQPSSAINKQVNWSVAWKDASSEWAHGKTVTNYVTVTPTSDGSAIATVSCSAAFGEQIVLTCASQFNPEIKATATIDYMKKITGFTIESNYVPISGALDQSITLTLDSDQSVFEYQFPEYYQDPEDYTDTYYRTFPVSDVNIEYSSVGTITPSDIEIMFYFTYDEELKTLLETQFEIIDHNRVGGGTPEYIVDNVDLSPYNIMKYIYNGAIYGYSTGGGSSSERRQAFFAANQIISQSDDTFGDFEVVITYNDDMTYTKNFTLTITDPLYPSSISIPQDNIVF